jgi:hypothetical protein
VDPQTFELEAGAVYFHKDGSHSYEIPFGLTYGLVRTVEIGVGSGGLIEMREAALDFEESDGGLGDLVAGIKWNPLSEGQWFFSQALAFAVKFPTADGEWGSGHADYDLTYIASKILSEKWNVSFNIGHTWVGDSAEEPFEDIFHTGGAAGWLIHPNWELVGELHADVATGGDTESGLTVGGGVRWSACRTCTLDALMSAGLGGDVPGWGITAGLTWMFDFKRHTIE